MVGIIGSLDLVQEQRMSSKTSKSPIVQIGGDGGDGGSVKDGKLFLRIVNK